MPYKDKDKLIHIFSVELGVVTGILKGVSAPTSKLKFASQPFCFGKFDLVKAKDFYVVKGVDLVDTFFDLTSDYESYKLCSLMLEICKVVMKPNIIFCDSLTAITSNGMCNHCFWPTIISIKSSESCF